MYALVDVLHMWLLKLFSYSLSLLTNIQLFFRQLLHARRHSSCSATTESLCPKDMLEIVRVGGQLQLDVSLFFFLALTFNVCWPYRGCFNNVEWPNNCPWICPHFRNTNPIDFYLFPLLFNPILYQRWFSFLYYSYSFLPIMQHFPYWIIMISFCVSSCLLTWATY